MVDRDVSDAHLGDLSESAGPIDTTEALAESEERFRLAMDNSAVGMCLVSPTGEFQRVNQALCRLLGRPAEELVRCSWQQLTHADDVDLDQGLADEVMAGRRDTFRILKRFLRSDGTLVWGDLSVSCVRNRDGSVRYFVSQVIDVTEREQSLIALEESRELFDLLMDRSAVGMALTAPDGVILRANEALAEFFGRSAAEIEERGWQDLTLPEDVAPETRLLAEVASGQRDSYRLLKRYRRPDGTLVWGDLTVTAVRDSSGQVRFFAGQVIDATDTKMALDTLRSTIASMVDPYVLLAAVRDERGEVVDLQYEMVNDAAATFLRVAESDILGRRSGEVLPGPGFEALLAWCREALRTGEAVVRDDVPLPSPFDDDPHWLDVRAVAVEDRVSVSWRDATERHRAAEALAAREANYRLLADNMTDVVVRSGPDRAIAWVSPSVTDVLGWRPEELVGRSMGELLHPDDRASVVGQQRAALAAGGTEGRVVMRIATASGGWLWMSDHGRAIVEDGVVIGGIDALRDVDAEYRVQEDLAERERHYRALSERAERAEQELRGVIDSLVDPWILLAAVRDDAGRIVDFEYVDANDAACTANRLPRERLIGARLMDLFPQHGPLGLLEQYARVVETGEALAVDDEPFVDVHDGRERRFDNRAVRVGDGISFTWRDVTDRYEMRRLLREQANQDLLTGLSNRRHLETRMGEIFSRAPRTGTFIGVLYCDVDLFKDINDRLGHAMGDQVLASVGAAIRASVRDADLVARVGGDEFVVVLDGVRGVDDAQAVSAKVVRAVRRPIVVAGTSLEPRISIGVAVTPYGWDPQEALERADAALYRAKRGGRDRIEVDEWAGSDQEEGTDDGRRQS